MLNTKKLLCELLEALNNAPDSRRFLLKSSNLQENLKVIPTGDKDVQDVNEVIPSEFLEELGIRTLSLNASAPVSIADKYYMDAEDGNEQSAWHSIKKRLGVDNLKLLFDSCKVISFLDWARLNSISDLWDSLRTEVIKPLGKKDYEFIFYLGDPTKKLNFQVDEILDIISDYSLNGKVTLVLNEREAVKLWMILKGYRYAITSQVSNPSLPELNEKHQYIFQSMNIERLLVFSVDRCKVFSRNNQYELTGRDINFNNPSDSTKSIFNIGYILGLLLNLKVSQSITLGLSFSGAYLENGTVPDRKALVSYIDEWLLESEHMPFF